MDEPPNVSMRKAPGIEPADELAAARQTVHDLIAAVPASLQAPTLTTSGPMRTLPPALEAKLAGRRAAGLAPLGTEHPRGRVWQRIVAPSGSFAALDAIGVAVAAADGRPLLAIAAGVLFVPFAGAAAAGARFATQDPLRLSTSERRVITDAGHWESKQIWPGPLSSSRERALVIAAAHSAGRIATSPAWSGGRLADHRVRLDLVVELDQIDVQAYRIATSSGSPLLADAWAALLTRVAGLTAYADGLDALVRREAAVPPVDPARDSDLLAGSVQGEIAGDDLAALRYFLTAAVSDDGPRI